MKIKQLLYIIILPAIILAGIIGLYRAQQPASTTPIITPTIISTQAKTKIAVIGDFGQAGEPEADVAALVKSWSPEVVITLGDNNYSAGAAATIDANIGQYYHDFIGAYHGQYGQGTTANRFYPVLGNHDWQTPQAKPYLDYFTLPGNERYYDFVVGSVHFYALDSNPDEPDGVTADSRQAHWLQTALAQAHEPFKLVYFHHPPFSSGSEHGPTAYMQWPYAQWGVTAVLSGHEHAYERISRDSVIYLICGLSGGAAKYGFGQTTAGSAVRYNDDYGAVLLEATAKELTFSFFTRSRKLIDTYTIAL